MSERLEMRQHPIIKLREYIASYKAEIERLTVSVKEMQPLLGKQQSEIESLTAKNEALRALVDEQAEDDGLWFQAVTAPEAYLQQELRRLHAAIEGTSTVRERA